MREIVARHSFLTVAALAWSTALPAQLTLAGALRTADRDAYANRVASAAANTANARRRTPLRGVLPSVRFEGGYLRTTDPIGAFGTRLKQREIAQSDFDPGRLNYPTAIGNYTAGVVVEQPLLNADSWLGRRAAGYGDSRGQSAAEWTRLSTLVDVIRAYYGAVLATERLTTLNAAAEAAQAHLRQADAMVRAGMATKSDALLAAVKAGDVEAERIEARSDATTARRQLAVMIGLGASAEPAVPARLPPVASIQQLAATDAVDLPSRPRADVDAARSGVGAARTNLQRARSLYLPRLNAFARYDWNSPQHAYGGEKSWTVGVLASWSPFDGASQSAEAQLASAGLELATADADAASDQARLETQRSLASLQAALARLDIAERAVAQSIEAHRIVTRKYEGGLATVVELLDAATVETQSNLALSHAQFIAITAVADRRRASGLDPGTLTSLDAAPAITAEHQ